MKRPSPGPTHDFPLGKLNPHDEGGIDIAISTEAGNVRIDFGEATSWIAFPPEQALELAELIVRRAMAIKAGLAQW